ncbi:hypothetical protein [Hydrogenophaga sp.]|uniref:hemerythrin domain-containing protein n=1 Tax=Hydrogenophaga sp. TaxID=1904254 RepID=UPI00356236F0
MTTLAAPSSQKMALAASPSTPRLDLYAPIHKALRFFMTDTLQRVGRMGLADPAEMTPTLVQFDALLTMCEAHVAHENSFMHPELEACQPGSTLGISDEHSGHLDSIAELRHGLRELRRAEARQRPQQALRLYRHLALFVAENLEHMHAEETALNALLWANRSDAQLRALHDRLLASLAPTDMLEIVRWMAPALNPDERIALLSEMQADAPPQAFAAVIDTVRPRLRDDEWGPLAHALGLPQYVGLVHY